MHRRANSLKRCWASRGIWATTTGYREIFINSPKSQLPRRKTPRRLAFLKASLALNREQGRVGDGAQQLRLLARLEDMQQRPDRAVRLFAAASVHESKERTLPPDDPTINKSALESARLALEEHRFESEWARGRAMSFDQAVSYALSS